MLFRRVTVVLVLLLAPFFCQTPAWAQQSPLAQPEKPQQPHLAQPEKPQQPDTAGLELQDWLFKLHKDLAKLQELVRKDRAAGARPENKAVIVDLRNRLNELIAFLESPRKEVARHTWLELGPHEKVEYARTIATRRPDDKAEIKIFRLKNAKAPQLAKTLNDLLQGMAVRITTDERTNSLLVRGSRPLLEEIQVLVRNLDDPE